MRRCSELEGFHKKPELLFCLLVTEAQFGEHHLLCCTIMDTDRTPSYFSTIDHHIISIGANLPRFFFQQRNIFRFRRSERVMHCVEAICLLAPFEQRKINYPER